MEEEKINIEDLLKQADEDAREAAKQAYERGAGKTVTMDTAVASLGAAAEGYIYTWYTNTKTLPDTNQKMAVMSMMIGVMTSLKTHEAFGMGTPELIGLAYRIYDAALSGAVSKANGQEE